MSAASRLEVGQTFGRYQIIRLIGEGGMGVVYEAIHSGLKKRFAIKTLFPAVAEKDEARRRFLREGEAAASINHPNVVAVSDVGTEEGIPYLVMEFLEGQTLGELLAEQTSLATEEAVALLLPVISAVATGHDRGVIHRDLKPQNIFLAKGPWGDKVPKVLDFGVSKLTGDDNAVLTRTLTVLGTAAYMSPEQARGAKGVDFQSDQYALGLILYEMLTGTRAHPGDNALEVLHNVATGSIRPLRELKPDLPPAMDAMVRRMLAVNRAERYPSLHECGRALLQLADDKTRLAMANAFAGRASVEPAGDGGTSRGDREAQAREKALSSSSGAGSTLPLPPSLPDSLSDTTLRHSAVEAAPPPPVVRPRSRAKVPVVLAAAVGVVLVAAAIVWTATKNVSVQSVSEISEREPSPAPAAPPARITQPTVPSVPSIAVAPPPAVPFEVRALPPEADLRLDDGPPARGRLSLVLPLAGPSHQIRVSAAGYLPKVISFGPDDRPPPEVRLERTPERVPEKIRRKATAAANPAPRVAPPPSRGSEPKPQPSVLDQFDQLVGRPASGKVSP